MLGILFFHTFLYTKKSPIGDFLRKFLVKVLGNFLHVDRCWAFCAFFNVERNCVPFSKILESYSHQLIAVEEYVFRDAFLADKAKFSVRHDFLDDSLHI